MPVGTDALLLGAWVDPGDALHILDIGTGCGVIALMAAQRSKGMIDAIDTDRDSVCQASANFNASPWKSRLNAIEHSFIEHANASPGKYDLILSNPPFFRNSLRSPDDKRNKARHQGEFTIGDLFNAAGRLLAVAGRFVLIAPWTDYASLLSSAADSRLFPAGVLKIKPKENKDYNRVIMCFQGDQDVNTGIHSLVIRKADNSFTDDYINLTIDFHLPLK